MASKREGEHVRNSLFRYFTGQQSRKKPKQSASNTSTSSTESSNSKVRTFQESWKVGRPWLEFSKEQQTMTCFYCKNFKGSAGDRSALASPSGCSTLRLETLKKHEESKSHKLAEIEHRVNTQAPENRPMEACILQMEKDNVEKMKKLFRTAYYLAQAERPYSDFAGLCNLMECMDVDLGETYRNEKQAAIFIHFIAEIYKANLVEQVKSSELFSLLIDSSTDVAVIDEEIMYLRLIENGRPVTKYFSIQALERGNAEGILNAIDHAFEKELNFEHNQWCEKVVGFGSDGASVMVGHRGGVSALIKRDIPHLMSIHCVAHRLELGIKGTIKDVVYHGVVDQLLLNLYKFYHNSPLNWENLIQTGTAIGVKVLKPVNIKGTRWIVHHENALKAVTQDWLCLVSHLEQVAIDGQTADAKAKASGFVRKLIAFRFVHFAHFLLDLYKVLSRISLEFQKNDTSLESVTQKLEVTIAAIRSLIATPGHMESEFLRNVGTGVMYKGKELYNRPTGFRQVQDDRQAVLQSCITHLQQRFKSFQDNDILDAMKVFEFRSWPLHRDRLMPFGNDKLQLLVDHFQNLLLKQNCDIPAILLEWQEFKIHVSQRVTVDPDLAYLDLWQRVILEKSVRFTNILQVLKIVLLVPIHTSECERGFSLMARVKNDWRANLSTDALNNLMTIRLCGPGVANIAHFDPIPAIQRWFVAGPRARRLNQKPYGPRMMEDSDEED